MLRFALVLLISITSLFAGGCVYYPARAYHAAVWVPGHWGGPYGNVWIAGHWR